MVGTSQIGAPSRAVTCRYICVAENKAVPACGLEPPYNAPHQTVGRLKERSDGAANAPHPIPRRTWADSGGSGLRP